MTAYDQSKTDFVDMTKPEVDECYRTFPDDLKSASDCIMDL